MTLTKDMPIICNLCKDPASSYDFDANLDSFSLLFQSGRQATVQVIKHDTNQTFKVDLVGSRNGDWNIVGVPEQTIQFLLQLIACNYMLAVTHCAFYTLYPSYTKIARNPHLKGFLAIFLCCAK
jgi:hypothetical protein